MIRYPNSRLPSAVAAKLRVYQDEIDHEPSYAAMVLEAKKKFKSRNTEKSATFRAVRTTLTRMCGDERRCMYCEDNVADEVEHFRPKDLYPEVVFAWKNYLYACGPCNGPKNAQFSVLDHLGAVTNVTRAPKAPIVGPISGDPVLIDPRSEDPFRFLFLDIRDTFEFSPHPSADPVAQLRADYTICVLGLNSRDYLIAARRRAFEAFIAILNRYVARRSSAGRRELSRMRKAVHRTRHSTVWSEMKRQSTHFVELDALFKSAPEAMTW
jgi:uncharacterized protein (TIGR02646 family)